MLIESVQYVLNNQKGVDLLLSLIKLYNENANCDYQLFEQIIRNIPDLNLPQMELENNQEIDPINQAKLKFETQKLNEMNFEISKLR